MIGFTLISGFGKANGISIVESITSIFVKSYLLIAKTGSLSTMSIFGNYFLSECMRKVTVPIPYPQIRTVFIDVGFNTVSRIRSIAATT